MPYVSLKTEPLFVLLWLYGVSVGQENPCGKSLLGSSCRESFGRNQQRTQGSLWGHVSVQGHGAAVCQCWKEGISWTPGSLGTRGSAGRQALCARCLSMNFQGVGYSCDRSWEVLWWWFIYLPLSEWCSCLAGAEQLPLETWAITSFLFLFSLQVDH